LKAVKAYWYVLQTTKEGNRLARKLAEEAITLDPKYAHAYRVLGGTHIVDLWLGLSKSPKKSLGLAIKNVRKAIALDDSLASAHVALGYFLIMARKYDQGIAEGKRAYDLEPSSADVLHIYAAILTFSGRRDEAIPLFKEALRLNPIPPNAYLRHFGVALRDSGQYKEAIKLTQRAIEREPNDLIAYIVLTSAYSMAGRQEEARSAGEEILRINPKFSLKRLAKTTPLKEKAVKDRFIEALRKAGLPDKPQLPLPDKPSIAVLPFVNMSGDPKQEYFSDGITEEIITALSKTPKLFIIARTSSFKYRGKEVDVRTVGRELGVRYVLEGSVRKAGDKVRITAQLIDAKTNNHLWAERYERDLMDIFAIQDDITKNIITAIQVKLTHGEQATLSAEGTKNLDAYLYYLQASDHQRQFNIEDNMKARQLADPDSPSKKRETSLRLSEQADRMSLSQRNYHQRGEKVLCHKAFFLSSMKKRNRKVI